ncbi:hypothetical protein MIR68_002968 [Amoeboaphelidium protococcarum]|nr:hypothetical protein MIR68_002968 [Amoeboaphelidium protococcarum]
MTNVVKIVSWNVNSLISFVKNRKKAHLINVLQDLDADLICFQEHKLGRDVLSSLSLKSWKDIAMPTDLDHPSDQSYDAYFAFSSLKKRYSGVVTYVKRGSPLRPIEAFDGWIPFMKYLRLDFDLFTADNGGGYDVSFDIIDRMDKEGRVVILDFGNIYLFNVYVPNINDQFKEDFFRVMIVVSQHLHSLGKSVIIVGDLNACAAEIDHVEPQKSIMEHGLQSFLDLPARRLLNELLLQFHDSFRLLYPNKRDTYTCWNTYISARDGNYGSRIDYILVSKQLKDSVVKADCLTDILGSDHCPVSATLKLPDSFIQLSNKESLLLECPPLCAKFYPEFKSQNSLLGWLQPQSTSLGTSSNKRGATEFLSQQDEAESVQAHQVVKTEYSNERLLVTEFSGKGAVEFKESTSSSIMIEKSRKRVKTESVSTGATGNNNINTPIKMKAEWGSIFNREKIEVPLCRHKEPCQELLCKKGNNKGRRFYMCKRPKKQEGDSSGQCNFFKWKTAK